MHKQVPGRKQALLVNMDETSIRFHQNPGEGHLVRPAAMQKQTARSLVQDVCTKALRGSMTLVAFICHDPEMQTALPQVLIASRAHVTEERAENLRRTLPENVFLWRGSKAWVTNDTMVRLMKILDERVRAAQPGRQILLYFDAFRAHWTPHALRAMTRCNIMHCLIPAKLTCVLQPLDSHVFGLFKHWLKIKCQMGQTLKEAGKLDALLLVKCAVECIKEVLEGRSWQKAFAETGLNGAQAGVSQRVLAQLGLPRVPSITDDIPELHHLQVLFPEGANIPIAGVFGCFLRAGSGDDSDRRHLHMEIGECTHGNPGMWHGRLRSSSSLRGPSMALSSTDPLPALPATTREAPLLGARRAPQARPLMGIGTLRLNLPRAL